MIEVGAFDAKNQFSKLLDRARRGEEFIITLRGVAVARLVPLRDERDGATARDIFARLRRRASEHAGAPISTEEVLAWKAMGHR